MNLLKSLILKNQLIILLWLIWVFIIQKNIKFGYYNNKFKISGPACNDEFGLGDGSYSIS